MNNDTQQNPEAAMPGAGSPPAQSSAVSPINEWHDFRDVTGDPMVKTWPITDWRSWERRQDVDTWI